MGEYDCAFARLMQRPRRGSTSRTRGPETVTDGCESSNIESGDVGDARRHSGSMRASSVGNLSFCKPASHRVRFDISMTNAIRQINQRGEATEAREAERDRDPKVAREVFPEAVVPAQDAFHGNRSGIGEWIAAVRRSTRPWRRAIGIWVAKSDAVPKRGNLESTNCGTDVNDRQNAAKPGDDRAEQRNA